MMLFDYALPVNTMEEMGLRTAARTLIESVPSGKDEILLLPNNLSHQYVTQKDILKLLDLFECENRPQSDVLV